MSKICDNGTIRDMTEEEQMHYDAECNVELFVPTLEEVVDDLVVTLQDKGVLP